MQRFIWLGVALTGLAGWASAAQIREGATACRNQQALLEMRAAERTGDARTMEWLYDGSACVKMPAGTEVDVIAESEDVRRLRTVNRRRNIELWVSADQIEAT